MGAYDNWKAREPDLYPDPRPGQPDDPLHRCRDCGTEVMEGGHGAPLVQAVYCSGCWSWRSAHGLAFDTRPKLLIEAALRKGAA